MMNKQRMVVEWSPHDPSLFAVGADNLRLYETTATDVDSAQDGPHGGASPATTTQRKRSFRLIKINASVHAQNAQLKCMEWYPFDAKPLWIVSGMGNGKVILSDFQDPRSRVVRELSPKYTRPCNAVAWNHAVPSQLAAGFEKVRSDYCTLVWDLNVASSGSTIMGSVGGIGSQTDPGGGLGSSLAGAFVGSHMDALGSVNDDLSVGGNAGGSLGVGGSGMRSGSFNRVGSANSVLGGGAGGGSANGGAGDASDKPVHELSNSEATMALSWVPLQPACLAVGTGFKWLRVYDLRASSASGAAPLSVVAHNKAVLGVVFDRHRPHILATYTDAPQEAIKVWDIRRLDTNVGPLVSLHHSSKTLTQVTWCPTKPGILATASAEERYLSLWDVTKHDAVGSGDTMQIKKPFRRRYTSEPLTSFSWQNVNYSSSSMMRARDRKDGLHSRLAAAAFPNRLLTASLSGEIEDISVHDSLPISVSPVGSLAFSCGRLLFGGATTDGSSSRERHAPAQQEDDIAMEMQRLAKARYSMVVEKNLRLFAAPFPTPRQRQLRSLWQWVDQVEALRRIQVSRLAQARGAAQQGGPALPATLSPLRGWPVDPAALTLVGVKNLLALADDSTPGDLATLTAQPVPTPLTTVPSVLKTDPVLGCPYYEGFGRRLAMFACNWDPDCGRGVANAAGNSSNEMSSLPPRQGGLTLHRSSSGAWTSQRQFEDNAMMAFGSRSSTENSRHELRQILAKCESEFNYARAAALAVFHGDLVAAVSTLQKGAMWLSQIQNIKAIHAPYSSDVLQLVAMAVAGYSTAATMAAAAPGMPNMWTTMCQQLLRRDEITSPHVPRYLHALLAFLCAAASASSGAGSSLNAGIVRAQPQAARRTGGNSSIRKSWGSVDGLSGLGKGAAGGGASGATSSGVYGAILNDATLPLSDRIGFACRFLPPEDLRVFVTLHAEECQQGGRLEGLLLTGLASDGVQLLQQYLDRSGDVQTLALLAARLPSAHTAKSAPVLENWIAIYQDLLNQWQLFHDRARFDVARSQHEDVLNGFANFVRDPDAEELHQELAAPPTLTVPPQLFVRCNYCNNSLSLANLLRLGGSHSSWLNRAKPKLTCCPSCRKPLPQCALCLLPLGALNPYLELAHRRSKQTAEAVASLVAGGLGDAMMDDPVGVNGRGGEPAHESLAQLSSIPFVEWFTWCQSCKHGGHAHHIADWFGVHSVCPVTDCGCHCQHMDLPIAQQKRQEEGRLLQEEQHEQDERQQQDHDSRQADAAGASGNATMAMPQSSPSRQDLSVGGGLKRRGSRSQQQMQQQLQAFGPGMKSGHGSGAGSNGAGSTPSLAAAAVLPPRMPPSRMGTPLVGASAAQGELGASMSGLTLSNKLDQLDKEKGTSFFL